MAAKKKHPGRARRAVVWIVALLFLGAATYGVIRSFVRAPEPDDTPPQDDTQTDGGQEEQPGGQPAQSDGKERKDGFYTILLCGTDDDNGGTDTNMLMAVDTQAGAIHVVSLPRDTLLDVEWTTKKLNHSYNVGGMTELRSQISRLLGVPVDYYVQVDLDGFVALVDTIKGVDFDVPLNMDYDDPAQNLSIHFKKGMQHLDGQAALEVVRFRHNNDGSGYGTEDIGRIGTQQAFLTAVAKKMLQAENLVKIGSYVDIFQKYVKSDLSTGNMIWLAQQAMSIGTDNISFHTLPGDGTKRYKGRSYYVLYAEETLQMVNDCLNPYTRPLTMADLDILTVD